MSPRAPFQQGSAGTPPDGASAGKRSPKYVRYVTRPRLRNFPQSIEGFHLRRDHQTDEGTIGGSQMGAGPMALSLPYHH